MNEFDVCQAWSLAFVVKTPEVLTGNDKLEAYPTRIIQEASRRGDGIGIMAVGF